MGASRQYPGTNGNGINYGDVTFMDGATGFTVTAWQNFSDISRYDGFQTIKNGCFFNIWEITGTVKSFIFAVGSSGLSQARTVDDITTLYSTGVWYYVTYTWSTPATFGIYTNGNSESLTSISGTVASLDNSADDLQTGLGNTAARPYTGLMAYNTLYTEAMTVEKITELMHNPFVIFENVQFNAPGWNPSATNEIDIIQGTSGTPTSASESFDGPPVGVYAAANQ
jgi:hypothetical protein